MSNITQRPGRGPAIRWDETAIGMTSAPRTTSVTVCALLAFAAATGETSAIYLDEAAAQAAGYAALPAPPTYAFSLALSAPDGQNGLFARLAIDRSRILHGEQSFRYHHPIVAGDLITLTSRILDLVEKKGGALTMLTTATTAINAEMTLCVEMTTVYVVRND